MKLSYSEKHLCPVLLDLKAVALHTVAWIAVIRVC